MSPILEGTLKSGRSSITSTVVVVVVLVVEAVVVVVTLYVLKYMRCLQ